MSTQSVTLFIQAHGEELFTDYSSSIAATSRFNPKPIVKLLSFSGSIFEAGKMALCKSQLSGEFNQPIDSLVIEEIQTIYKTTTNRKANALFGKMGSILKRIYSDCRIRFKQGGFKIIFPKTERIFYLQPNAGEDRRMVPDYGITVVSSSIDSDFNYTLQGIDGSPSMSNWSSYHDNINYWLYERSNLDEDRQMELFDKIVNQKQILLSEIVELFTSAGFNEILIYDPTCRHIQTEYTITAKGKIKSKYDSLERGYFDTLSHTQTKNLRKTIRHGTIANQSQPIYYTDVPEYVAVADDANEGRQIKRQRTGSKSDSRGGGKRKRTRKRKWVCMRRKTQRRRRR